jgi:hypothetical protein
MKRNSPLWQYRMWLIPIAFLALASAMFFVAARGHLPTTLAAATPAPAYPGPAATVTVTPLSAGYPAPLATLTARDAATQGAVALTEIMAVDLTSSAIGTASYRTPEPTWPYPLMGPMCFKDPINKFSLKLPAGWFADPPPPAGALAGASEIYNFDPTQFVGKKEAELQSGYLKIEFGSAPLPADRPFELWLSDEIARERTTAAPALPTISEPVPFTFGKYKGQTYLVSVMDYETKMIALPIAGMRVLFMAFIPADSTVQAQAFEWMAKSLAVSPDEFC